MQHTEKKLLEINISGDNAKEETLKKITDFIEQNPVREKLTGAIYVQTRDEKDDDIQLKFDMERPDTQRVRESFSQLPDSVKFDGVLFLHIRTWTD